MVRDGRKSRPERARPVFSWVDPAGFGRSEDAALLLLRLTIGAFLVWGTLDNIVSPARMAEFETFLRANGFALPAFAAPLSVWAQFGSGVALIAGLLTRWAGLVIAVNFVVALVMVDAAGGIRAAFPAAMLVVTGLYLAARGAGRWSADALIR